MVTMAIMGTMEATETMTGNGNYVENHMWDLFAEISLHGLQHCGKDEGAY